MKLLDVLLEKIERLDQLHKKKSQYSKNGPKVDEFVKCEKEEIALEKSIWLLLLLILKMLCGDYGAWSELKDYLMLMGDNFKDAAKSGLGFRLNGNEFSDYLKDCLGFITDYCREKEKGKNSKNGKVWEKALNDFSIVLSLSGVTAISKLLKIAKNTDYPEEVRALAMALVNDALSHMKGRHVDNRTAKALIGLIKNTPDNVRYFLYSALKDARTIEKETRQGGKGVAKELTLA